MLSKRRVTPFAVARFDGVLLYNTVQAGIINPGSAELQVAHFKVHAGRQLHPVWALGDLAQEIYSYCITAQKASVSGTHLQVSLVGTWVSTEQFSIVIATNVEWHIASSMLREQAEHAFQDIRNGKRSSWPMEILMLPVSADSLSPPSSAMD